MMNTTTQITVVYIADGYLAAAADTEEVWGDGYFFDLQYEEGFEMVEVEVDEELADQLKRQGTSDQHFSDGYGAAQALAVALQSK